MLAAGQPRPGHGCGAVGVSHTEKSSSAIRYGPRYPSTSPTVVTRGCPVCGGTPSSSRSIYCKPACTQLAYRLRHQASHDTVDPGVLRKQVQHQRQLVAHTVYECARCGERFLGERRCPDCNLYGRSVGLGGSCPECDAVILLADLLGLDAPALFRSVPRTYPQPLDTDHPHNDPAAQRSLPSSCRG
jgi:hypothetical protein